MEIYNQTNKEFFDYLLVSGILGNDANIKYINELRESESYIGDYYKSLYKYTNEHKELIYVLYYLNRHMKKDIRHVLSELLDVLKKCDFYFGKDDSRRLFNSFKRLVILGTYAGNSERLLKELRIVLNPFKVTIDNEVYSISRHMAWRRFKNKYTIYEMSLRNIKNEEIENSIGILICNSNTVERVKIDRWSDPFNILKERIDNGLEYELIGICDVVSNKNEDMVRLKLDNIFGELKGGRKVE